MRRRASNWVVQSKPVRSRVARATRDRLGPPEEAPSWKTTPSAEYAQGKQGKGPQGKIGSGESAGETPPSDDECGKPLEGDRRDVEE